MCSHDPQSAFFFKQTGEDMVRAHDFTVAIREAMSQVKGGLASMSAVSKIAKGNTRLSSSVMADLLEKDEKARKPADPH